MGNDRKNGRKWSFSEIASVLLGTLSIFVTIGIYILNRPPKLNLEARINSPHNLIEIQGVEDLAARLYYRGEAVDNFWVSHFDIVNIGTGTIIGKGGRSHLINENIDIAGSTNCKILGVSYGENDFARIFSTTNLISISFDQWKKGEVVSFDVFSEMRSGAPSFDVCGRPIMDGSFDVVQCDSSPRKHYNDLGVILPIMLAVLTVLTAMASFVSSRVNRRIRSSLYERIASLLETQREQFKKIKKLQKTISKQARERDALQDS